MTHIYTNVIQTCMQFIKNLFLEIYYMYKNWELFLRSFPWVLFLNMNSKWFKNKSFLIICKILYIKYSYSEEAILKSLSCRIFNKITQRYQKAFKNDTQKQQTAFDIYMCPQSYVPEI